MARKEIIEKFVIQLITDGRTEPEIMSAVNGFLKGGGRWVQLRMKSADEDGIINMGRSIKKLCHEYRSVFIVNDNPVIAKKLGADGVHIGKNDMAPDLARKILGPDAIIGCTANSIHDIEKLSMYDIDYVGLGPFRFTSTKKNLSPVLGIEGYNKIFCEMKQKSINLPVTVIGGINLHDIEDLKKAGVNSVAISGAINKSGNPENATREFLKLLI